MSAERFNEVHIQKTRTPAGSTISWKPVAHGGKSHADRENNRYVVVRMTTMARFEY